MPRTQDPHRHRRRTVPAGRKSPAASLSAASFSAAALIATAALGAGCTANTSSPAPAAGADAAVPADTVATFLQLPARGSIGGLPQLPPLPQLPSLPQLPQLPEQSSQIQALLSPGAVNPAAARELPGGGTQFFPGRRLVALYGHPGAPGLGVLGEQGPDASIARVQGLAAQYAPLSDVPVVPALEIIATVAQQAPGADGDFSGETAVGQLVPWVDKAAAAGVYVILDLQPGRADILDQAKIYEPLLRRPNVGLAIDPEWKLGPGQLPLQRVGHVDAAALNRVADWLDSLAAPGDPQTLLVVHQFQSQMVRGEDTLAVSRPHVQVLVHMDGQGAPSVKDDTWRTIRGDVPDGMPLGWKNFYRMDHPMLTPEQTMAHAPQPLMISYQ